MQEQNNVGPALSRRDFLRNTSLLAASAAAVGAFPGIARAQSAAKINAVVVGFGGRGAGAARNFLDACKIAGVEGKIVAVADVFPGQASRAAEIYGVPQDKCFSGFDGYQKALDQAECNYAILATPPGFRPAYFKAAVAAGKNVFAEKPVAVDGPGCRIMYEAAETAKSKGLKVAVGTQRRHHPLYLETIKRIHAGEIGDVVSLRVYWVGGGPIWHRGLVGDSDIERQVRNWYHYIWLCGDHIVEQHVHNIDIANWVVNDAHPVKCWGMGARQQLDSKPGEIWDNFAVEYEYENGVRMHSYCGQIKRERSSVSEWAHGSKGMANVAGMIRKNDGGIWRFREKTEDPFVLEHVDLINAIVKETELNEAKRVTDSTLTAIMGREAAYSGKEVDWETALNSTFKYGPEEVYADAANLKFGSFRTLQPPMPSRHDIFANPPVVEEVKPV